MKIECPHWTKMLYMINDEGHPFNQDQPEYPGSSLEVQEIMKRAKRVLEMK